MKKFLIALCGLLLSLASHAEIYKHVDAEGHVTYSNVPMKGATRLNLEPNAPSGGTSQPRPASTPSPAGFPRVDQETQRQRDDKRLSILKDELAAERQALEQAKKNYAEGEANPEVFRTKEGKIRRNVPLFEEKMQKLREEVSLHEKNVQLLEKELGSAK